MSSTAEMFTLVSAKVYPHWPAQHKLEGCVCCWTYTSIVVLCPRSGASNLTFQQS
jgi:hypothetical protein